jgi:mono/diheme cytochrome c family protein
MRHGVAWPLGVLLLMVSCHRGQEPAPGDPLAEVFLRQAQEEGLSRAETDGKRLFAHYCATCHGESGHGDGQNSYNLDPKPPDFEASLPKNPSSYWRAIVEGGTASVGRSPLCPPWGRSLSSESVDHLVSYLEVLGRSGSEKAQPAEQEAPESPSDQK